MRALFDDTAPVHDQNTVHFSDGGQAMRNGDDGLALHHAVQSLLDRGLYLAIKRARGFVQQKDRRVLEDDPCQRDALPLPADSFTPRSPTCAS